LFRNKKLLHLLPVNYSAMVPHLSQWVKCQEGQTCSSVTRGFPRKTVDDLETMENWPLK